MRFRSVLVFVIALLLIVPAALAQESTAVEGTQWQLVSIDGEAVIEGTSITLIFGEQQRAGGSGGCNSYGSRYTLTGDDGIAFTGTFSTMMACLDSGVMDQELAYFAALEAATAYAISDGQLVITYGDGQTFVFDPAPVLPDTEWRLVSLGDAAVIAGSEITLAFDAQGGVNGSGGCNLYSATYTADGDRLTFGPVVSTERACLDEALMQQEMSYFAALSAATGYTVDDDILIIGYGGEYGALVFERVRDVAGTAWQLESIGDTTVSGTITLIFDEAGGAAGSGGCNRYRSSYTLSGDTITFQPIVSTRMACADDVMQLESTFFAALQAAARIHLTDERLTIFTADGEALVFTQAAAISSSM